MFVVNILLLRTVGDTAVTKMEARRLYRGERSNLCNDCIARSAYTGHLRGTTNDIEQLEYENPKTTRRKKGKAVPVAPSILSSSTEINR